MVTGLQEFLRRLESEQPELVVHESRDIDPGNHDVAAYLQVVETRRGWPVVVFENARNLLGERSRFPLVHNVFATRSLCAQAIGLRPEQDGMELTAEFGRLQGAPVPWKVVRQEEAPVLQNVWCGDEADVRRLPAARYHEKDAGPYFVMACVMKGRSGPFYDVTMTKNMVQGPAQMSISAHGHHHLARIIAEYEAAGVPAPVAVVLGHHPAFYLGSCALTPYGNDDYATIGGYMGEPLRLVPSATLGEDFLIPADAEIVIEGYVEPGKRAPQNPFGEISGHYQNRMDVPVVRVTAICFRNNAMMQGIFPSHAEHINLGGVPKEGSVYEAIKRVVPEVRAVHLPHSGRGRFSAYIAVDKRTPRDVQVAALVAFAEVQNLKLAVVVDSEINVFDEAEVLWAVATQTRWDKDVSVIRNVQTFRKWLGDAVCIIDATRPGEVADFPERNRIPGEALERMSALLA